MTFPDTPDMVSSSDTTAPPAVNEVKAVRAAQRLEADGKAISSERSEMYDAPDNASGESGTQGDETGRENQNPVGAHK